MPFTPFHMGPALFIKTLLQGCFSIMVFGWSQIIMDIQPLIVLLTGEGHLHGFTHTYIGAFLIGVISVLTGKYAAEYGLRFINLTSHLPISWPTTIISAFIGTFSHVLLDSIMHADMAPFAPLSENNLFFGLMTIEVQHDFCLYSGLIGVALFAAVSLRKGITSKLSGRKIAGCFPKDKT